MTKQGGLPRIAGLKNSNQFMEITQAGFTDVTGYESYITYPADAKLIRRGRVQVYDMFQGGRKKLEFRQSRVNRIAPKPCFAVDPAG